MIYKFSLVCSLSLLLGVSFRLLVHHKLPNPQNKSINISTNASKDLGERNSENLRKGLSESMPDFCNSWNESMSEELLGDQVANEIFRHWALTNTPQAIELTGRFKSTSKKTLLVSAVIREIADNDLARACDAIRNLPANVHYVQVLEILVSYIARSDLQSAWKYVNGVDGEDKERIANAVISSALTTDFEQAERLVESLPKGTLRSNLIKLLSGSCIAYNPEHAMELAFRNQFDSTYENVSELVRRWGDLDPQSAADWISKFPPGELRDKATVELFKASPFLDTNFALEVADKFPDGIPPEASAIITRTWGRKDPETVKEWIEKLPADTREDPSYVLGWSWGAADAVKCATWIESLQQNNLRNYATKGLSELKASRGELAEAMKWAATITNEEQKVLLMRGIAFQWIYKDPLAAKEWIRSTKALPEHLIVDLLNGY